MSQDSPSPPIHGYPVDSETRCVHWFSPLDIVALQFSCCRKFYPCYDCHQQFEDNHSSTVWTKKERQHPAILCGHCKHLLGIQEYIDLYKQDAASASAPLPKCPHCKAPFNPGCRSHLHLYFEMSTEEVVGCATDST